MRLIGEAVNTRCQTGKKRRIAGNRTKAESIRTNEAGDNVPDGVPEGTSNVMVPYHGHQSHVQQQYVTP